VVVEDHRLTRFQFVKAQAKVAAPRELTQTNAAKLPAVAEIDVVDIRDFFESTAVSKSRALS
jgi:hypothetical protein